MTTDTEHRVLVAGATGVVGGQVARRLLADGVAVRAIGRNAEKLKALAAAGAEAIAIDLRDRAATARACLNVSQIYSSVNNVMGRGESSPHRHDLAAHASLCDGARAARVERIVYLSGRDMTADCPVDFFRIKQAIEATIAASGVSYVLMQPSAFMETWVGMMSASILKNRSVTLFGDGRNPSNFIAVDDVVDFSMQILRQREIHNEAIELGGPSNISFNDLATLLAAHFRVELKRRHIPVTVLRLGSLAIRPFNEVVSRFMSMGYFTATENAQFLDWSRAATRFSIAPLSIEAYIARLPRHAEATR